MTEKHLALAIRLGTLAVCALLIARGATALLAAKLLPPPVAEAAAIGHPSVVTQHKQVDPHELLKRNIFDSALGALWPPPVKDVEPSDAQDVEAPEVLAPGQMPPPCPGDTKLVAAIYSPRHQDWSFAAMSTTGGVPMLYRPGQSVGSDVLVSVFPEAVFMRQGGRRTCSLALFRKPLPEGSQPVASNPGIAEAQPEPETMASPSPEGDPLQPGITRVSETQYSIARTTLDSVLSNQAALMRAARVVPHEENGQTVGIKLYGIRRNSILGQLGLQNGDMIRTINGFDIASPDKALEAYTRLRSESNVSVSVDRRGRPTTINYNVQ